MKQIETPRTLLRRLTLKDLDNMILLESDADIVRYTPYSVPQTREQTLKRLEGVLEKEPSFGEFGIWALELKKTSEFAGWFMLNKVKFQFPELGFMIVKKFWGRGYATEMALKLVQYAFEEGEDAVVAKTNVENFSSIRVLEKAGFKFSKMENGFKNFQIDKKPS